jgi:DNA-binding NtrC family response regulator
MAANAFKSKPERLLREGFFHFLAKPFTPGELKDFVENVLKTNFLQSESKTG